MTPSRQLAVLAYHKIGPPSPGAWETWFYVSSPLFLEHLEVIRDTGWTPIGIHALVAGLDAPELLPARSVLITFDDGYRSVLDVAQPLLERFGYPAVMFMPTAHVACTNVFDDGIEPAEPLCTWRELQELDRRGIAVESHGHSHVRLSTLADPDRERERELTLAKSELERHLGKRVTLFSYPYGDAGEDTQAAAEALAAADYRAAFRYGGGITTWPGPNRYLLPRIAIGSDTDLRDILREES